MRRNSFYQDRFRYGVFLRGRGESPRYAAGEHNGMSERGNLFFYKEINLRPPVSSFKACASYDVIKSVERGQLALFHLLVNENKT